MRKKTLELTALRRAELAPWAIVSRPSEVAQDFTGHHEAIVHAEHKVFPLVCKPRTGWAWCPLSLGELVHTLRIYPRPKQKFGIFL